VSIISCSVAYYTKGCPHVFSSPTFCFLLFQAAQNNLSMVKGIDTASGRSGSILPRVLRWL
jgi:hypothetical protein